jgi:hypothetical protein
MIGSEMLWDTWRVYKFRNIHHDLARLRCEENLRHSGSKSYPGEVRRKLFTRRSEKML